MRENPDDYAPFLEGGDVAAFTNTMLMTGTEIDHVGFKALADALLIPAGLGLEIVSLNRYSTGEGVEVVPHLGEQEPLGIVRTLHRP